MILQFQGKLVGVPDVDNAVIGLNEPTPPPPTPFPWNSFTDIGTIYQSLGQNDQVAFIIRHSERSDDKDPETHENMLTEAGIQVTRSILTSLMNEIPLTPIEEDEDCWNECGLVAGKRTFQCSRRPSLFKDVLESDGSISYHDNELVVVDDVYEDHLSAVGSHFGDVIVKQMFGELVKFPYMPTKERYRVRRIETSLVYDGEEVAYVHFIKKPNGEKIFMNCFFDWNGKNYGNAPLQELSPIRSSISRTNLTFLCMLLPTMSMPMSIEFR